MKYTGRLRKIGRDHFVDGKHGEVNINRYALLEQINDAGASYLEDRQATTSVYQGVVSWHRGAEGSLEAKSGARRHRNKPLIG